MHYGIGHMAYPPGQTHPPGKHTLPQADTPPGQAPPQVDTSPGRHPQADTCNGQTPPWADPAPDMVNEQVYCLQTQLKMFLHIVDYGQ